MKTWVSLIVTAGLLMAPAWAKVTEQQYVQLREEGFGAAQGLIVSAAADALNSIGLRFSEGSDQLAELVRQQADLANRIGALQRQLDSAPETKDADGVALRTRIRQDLQGLRSQRDAVAVALKTQFPAYAELTRPTPLSSQAVRAILDPNEAMLVIVPGPQATYLFALTSDRFDWARTPISEADIAQAVRTLRSNLDASGTPPPFDRAAAFKLYVALIKPLEPLFADKKVLFTLTTGALQSLPLGLLTTDPPQGNDADPTAIKATHWLIDRYALVTLPAVSSLQTLRCVALPSPNLRHQGCPTVGQLELRPPPRHGLAFVGIGNPVLQGAPISVFRSGAPSAYARGELADRDKLLSLPRLPGTEEELQALQTHFSTGTTKLYLAADATETTIKKTPDVGNARILAFATHALVAGQTGRIGEPGLVLTPPQQDKVSAADDGLLTASEVAELRLSADFVLLSACNTAGANNQFGADGLSGLARAFFYAGARSLLVSNWSVSDAATPKLMNLTFDNLDRDAAAGRAQAFQKAIVTMTQDPKWFEPRYWAAFVLVGDTTARQTGGNP